MIIAVEDEVSEAVVRKLISCIRSDIQIKNVVGKSGRTYLQKKARELNRTASKIPVFLLVDLDSHNTHPSDVIKQWLGGSPQQYLLFRFAITEVESWVMADRENFSNLLSVPVSKISLNTDTILDPKEFLIKLARSSRSSRIKKDLIPKKGSSAKIGPAYNPVLIQFVKNKWNPKNAALRSNSLKRAINKLKLFIY